MTRSIRASRLGGDDDVLRCGRSEAMNRIVRNHYPASKLPEDLREGIDPQSEVSVTVEEVERPKHVMTIEEIWASRRPPFRDSDEIIRTIRDGRDDAE